ncbi:MAG: superoxide dismutase [Patescibacteria group bacterium]
MLFEPQNFDHLIGTQGFSDTLMKNHFTLYQGYVTNTNKLTDAFKKFRDEGTLANPEAAELRRRFGWEFNGMRLHELYFGNMTKGKSALPTGEKIEKKIVADFGSTDAFMKEFKAVGSQRGIGWAVLTYDIATDHLFNIWVNEHDVGHLAATAPLLIMDVFEHAFVLDYGLKRADYIEAFWNAIDWSAVDRRLGLVYQG